MSAIKISTPEAAALLRLERFVTAVTYTDAEMSAKERALLVRQAKAVRMFVEARQRKLAHRALDDLTAAVRDEQDEQRTEALEQVAADVRKAFAWEEQYS